MRANNQGRGWVGRQPMTLVFIAALVLVVLAIGAPQLLDWIK